MGGGEWGSGPGSTIPDSDVLSRGLPVPASPWITLFTLQEFVFPITGLDELRLPCSYLWALSP